MKTPNKICYLKEVFVSPGHWKIAKLSQTCFTRRGLEISRWPKHILTPRGEKSAVSHYKDVYVSDRGRTCFQFLAYNLFLSKNLNTQMDSYWVANEDKRTRVA